MNKYLSVACVVLSLALYGSWTKEKGQTTFETKESVTSDFRPNGRVLVSEPEIVYVPTNNKDVWEKQIVNGLPYWKNLTTGDYLYIEPPYVTPH